MALKDVYAMPCDESRMKIPQDFDALFNFDYSDDREDLLKLYAKGKEMQWDAATRIDWDTDIDPFNPNAMPDELLPIFGAPCYKKMTAKEQALARLNYQAWVTSQFLHGEQGALICAAKVVTQVPDSESKLYAATQVVDEARHVEVYQRFLDKIGLAYPVSAPLKELLDQVLRDSRWDMTYLGMQVVIEGLALAAFATIRDNAQNTLAGSINAYVMQDEARHVAFGRLALREYYPQLTQAERNEREEFLVEACYLMRDRFEAREVWETIGLPVDECVDYMNESEAMQMFRTFLFSRIVPVVKDIGLWGDKIQEGYGKMGILGFGYTNLDLLEADDERIAAEYDARTAHIESVADIARGAAE